MSFDSSAPADAGPRERPRLRKFAYRGDPLAEPPPPELSEIISRHRGERDGLITVLEEIQRRFGYLGERQLRYVARDLGFPLARIYGVVTFYNWFLLTPPGLHQVKVCRGTACHVNGSALILDRLIAELAIGVDETTPDGRLTLQTVACVGACSLAAVVVVGSDTYGRMSPEEALRTLAALPGGDGDSG
ncbi:MAG: NAD(P)H-dependent oxidoreductase subunit E [Actinobacteria bacterium]|nr:NAD(P)H-dependent oxidoreductase subunit E [Actinomycetota bacterium]